jgi:hypothetical protein
MTWKGCRISASHSSRRATTFAIDFCATSRLFQADIDRLFADSKALRLSADIANIAKHFDLTRPPRAGRQLSFGREHVPGGMGWFGRDGTLVVLSDGEKTDVLHLATEAEQAWTAFLRERGCL